MKTNRQLVVKELALMLGVSPRFIYRMRYCGFTMHGATKDNQTASVQEAVDWIEKNDFRIVNGLGVTGNPSEALT